MRPWRLLTLSFVRDFRSLVGPALFQGFPWGVLCFISKSRYNRASFFDLSVEHCNG